MRFGLPKVCFGLKNLAEACHFEGSIRCRSGNVVLAAHYTLMWQWRTFSFRMFWSYCCLHTLILCELVILTLLKIGILSPVNFSRQVFILNLFSQFRYAAYRASSCYIWGKLGSRNRRPLPACIGKWPF